MKVKANDFVVKSVCPKPKERSIKNWLVFIGYFVYNLVITLGFKVTSNRLNLIWKDLDSYGHWGRNSASNLTEVVSVCQIGPVYMNKKV